MMRYIRGLPQMHIIMVFCIDKEGVTEEWLNSKAKSTRMYGKLCKFGDEEKAIQIAQQKLERCKREGKTKPFCVQHF